MARYKNIKSSEFKFYKGDLIIFGIYPKNDLAEEIAYRLAKKDKFSIIFNLEDTVRRNFEIKLNKEDLLGNVYTDDVKRIDIEHIESKCYELSKKVHIPAIFINCGNEINYTTEELKRLKELSDNLRTNIVIEFNLRKNKKYPKLDDLENEDVKNMADVIVLRNDKTDNKSVLAKNKYGKFGILCFDD